MANKVTSMDDRIDHEMETRNRVHDAWAKYSWGLFGRSPDHVAGWIEGMACTPEVFEMQEQGFAQNILNYYRYIRDNDLFVAYAVVPPASAKSADALSRAKQTAPPDSKWGDSAVLHVVKEDETDAAVFCDNVHNPGSSVFAHGHTDSARAIFNNTSAHVLGNAEAHTKLSSVCRLVHVSPEEVHG